MECRCFVLTLRNLFGTFGLEGKYLEVTRVSIGTVLSEERRSSFKWLNMKTRWSQHDQEEQGGNLMNQFVKGPQNHGASLVCLPIDNVLESWVPCGNTFHRELNTRGCWLWSV